jgi:hypothetical protein
MVRLLSASSTHCHTSLPSATEQQRKIDIQDAQNTRCSNHAPPHSKPGTSTKSASIGFLPAHFMAHHSQRHDVSSIWISTCSTLVQRRYLCGVRSNCGQNSHRTAFTAPVCYPTVHQKIPLDTSAIQLTSTEQGLTSFQKYCMRTSPQPPSPVRRSCSPRLHDLSDVSIESGVFICTRPHDSF